MFLNQQNLRALFAGYRTSFNTGFRTDEVFWKLLATLVPSTTHTENYGWLGQFPNLREWIGDRHVKNMAAHDYSIKNRKFESTIGVPVDDIEDDTYGVYSPLFQEMGFAAAVHPDQLVFELLLLGFERQCYDGQYFFDDDHLQGGESVSNKQDGSGNPWFLLDTRRALKPLIYQRRKTYRLRQMTAQNDEVVFMRDEYRYGVDGRCNAGFGFWQQALGSKAAIDQDSFNDAMVRMASLKSDEKRPLGIRPNVLIHGPSNRVAAAEVLKVERLANGKTNINQNAVKPLEIPWLP